MSALKIEGKIVKYRVDKPAERAAEAQAKAASAERAAGPAGTAPPGAAAETANVIWMHEKLERPEVLIGSTYKIKTPVSDHAMYVTINDIVLNEGTEHEQRRPFEIFINSKNLDHFQWIVALTRIISAVFRKGGARVEAAHPDFGDVGEIVRTTRGLSMVLRQEAHLAVWKPVMQDNLVKNTEQGLALTASEIARGDRLRRLRPAARADPRAGAEGSRTGCRARSLRALRLHAAGALLDREARPRRELPGAAREPRPR